MTEVKKHYRSNPHLYRLLAITVLWMLFMAVTRFDKFYTFKNFQTIAAQFPEFGLMSLGGLMMLSTYASARADYGSQYTLQTILIVVLGGVSPNGGKGKISGVILAIILLKLLESGINRFQNISSYYISLIWGGVLILAMVMDYVTGDKRSRA